MLGVDYTRCSKIAESDLLHMIIMTLSALRAILLFVSLPSRLPISTMRVMVYVRVSFA